MPQTYQVETQREDRAGIARVSGEFDLSAAEAVEAALKALEAECDVIVLDLREITFLDSTGLRTITSADARSRAGEFELKIVRGPEHVQKLLHVTGMDKILPLVDHPGETLDR
jgi:anti-anti-sigma factor